MSDAPFFSVVIPSYNRGHLLPETIRSVLQQTHSDLEIIIVDDGSTDNTEDVVQSMRDERIRYFCQENAERGAARNKGVREAKGEYITFLDSDDRFFPNHLSVVKKQLTTTPVSFYFQPYCIMDAEGKVCENISGIGKNLNLMLVKIGNYMSCHGVFLQRSLALSNPFNEDRALAGSEDYELWLRLAARVPIHAGKEVTSALVLHSQRSVYNFSFDDLITRKEKMVHYIQQDELFMKTFGEYIAYIKSGAYSYVAVHMPFRGAWRRNRFNFWLRAVISRPSFIISKRSLVILRQIVFAS